MNLMQASIIWHSQKRKISELKPAPYNPRELTEKQAQDLATSLELFNLAEPIVINQNNTIVGGHQRINILKAKYGDNGTEVDVRVPNRLLTQDEEVELNLRLNKNLGQWNFDALANFDEELLKDVGFESQELDKIFQLDLPNEDDVPEVRKTNIKLGDMFQLDEHRLLCGDATKKEDVEKLMQGEKADMVFTDPPYGVSYGDKNKFLNAVGGGNRIQVNLKNDTLSADASKKLWLDAWKCAIEVMREGAVYYICSADANLMMMMMSICEAGLKLKQSLVWVKNNIVLGHRDYKCAHENILYGWKGSGHKFYGRSGESSVFEFNKPQTSRLHPTMKPVDLISHCIMNSSQWSEIVLDLFGGSGSTMIAAEKLNRKCRMTEIDPIYCQVIIDRWQNFTGKKAKKLNVGSNSDELVGCGVKYP